MGTPERQGQGREINYTGVTVVAGGIVVITVLAMLAMIGVFDFFTGREARRQPRATTLTPRPAVQLPPEPRLQADPVRDLAAFRADEEARMEAWGWADQSKGLARVPVDRAMELIVQKGLPARSHGAKP